MAQVKKFKCQTVADHFGLSVGSIMRYYSVWSHIHSGVLKYMTSWGDADFGELAQKYNIPMDVKTKEKFDTIEVLQQTSMYPQIWNKTQSEEYQMAVAEKILITHLRTRPPKALAKELVVTCFRKVKLAISAEEKLDDILKECDASICSKMITEIDCASIKASCGRLRKRIKLGDMDQKLVMQHGWPCEEVKSLSDRLTIIKLMAYQRKQDEMKRKEAAEMVCVTVYIVHIIYVSHYSGDCKGQGSRGKSQGGKHSLR